jgi:hydroxymethylbilane synthase
MPVTESTTDLPPVVRLGTRASPLARWQADWVADQLSRQGTEIEIVEITTLGDANRQGPIHQFGGQGVFTKAIQSALSSGTIDLAVHSLKDLPTEPTEGLTLAAVPVRERSDDALVSVRYDALDQLPGGARVGTGSIRRRAQLMGLRPDLEIIDIRGNLETRLDKLESGEYEAILLAAAGLRRLGLERRISELLSPPRMLPAPGQGALGIECRAQDPSTIGLLSILDHPLSRQTVTAERTLLAALRAGCLAPVGAWGRLEGDLLVLDAVVAEPDGQRMLRTSQRGTVEDADALGKRAAADLLAQGADAIIAKTR